MNPEPSAVRHLVVVLGDQLDRESAALDDFDPDCDCVWMAEVDDEAQQVWSHKARIALFLAAMRAYRDALRGRGWRVEYAALGEHPHQRLQDALAATLAVLTPAAVIWVQPGEWRLQQSLAAVIAASGTPLEARPDRHFYCTPEAFARWAGSKRSLTLEFFYRWLRQREGVLMQGRKPVGGRWNFDADNRAAFDARGPGLRPAPLRFAPDAAAQDVLALVQRRFADHPGSLADFGWALTPEQAEAALEDFITHRLPDFGRHQDAMWTDQPWLSHSLLSTALNLKLIRPRRVVEAALAAWEAGAAPLAAVEGFVRQILGWREYVRGIYWQRMPDYGEGNALDARQPLPALYWSGETDMACLRAVVEQTLALGYAHHIQRLMVTGLFALLLGVRPRAIHAWYLAIYVDAVEWVELPNVIGMSQYADGGQLGSKPYCASGKYIQRMSNYCRGCRFRPEQAVGADACPFTTLYWDFLDRHRARFERHPRTALQWRALARKDEDELAAIRAQAAALREQLAVAAWSAE